MDQWPGSNRHWGIFLLKMRWVYQLTYTDLRSKRSACAEWDSQDLNLVGCCNHTFPGGHPLWAKCRDALMPAKFSSTPFTPPDDTDAGNIALLSLAVPTTPLSHCLLCWCAFTPKSFIGGRIRTILGVHRNSQALHFHSLIGRDATTSSVFGSHRFYGSANA